MGMSLDEAKRLQRDDILDLIGLQLHPNRMRCALLSLKVWSSARQGSTNGN